MSLRCACLRRPCRLGLLPPWREKARRPQVPHCHLREQSLSSLRVCARRWEWPAFRWAVGVRDRSFLRRGVLGLSAWKAFFSLLLELARTGFSLANSFWCAGSSLPPRLLSVLVRWPLAAAASRCGARLRGARASVVAHVGFAARQRALFLDQGLNLCLLLWRAVLYRWASWEALDFFFLIVLIRQWNCLIVLWWSDFFLWETCSWRKALIMGYYS